MAVQPGLCRTRSETRMLVSHDATQLASLALSCLSQGLVRNPNERFPHNEAPRKHWRLFSLDAGLNNDDKTDRSPIAG